MNTLGTREGEDVEEHGRARQELRPQRGRAREGGVWRHLEYVSEMQPARRYYHSYFTGKETKAQSGKQLAQGHIADKGTAGISHLSSLTLSIDTCICIYT